MIDIKLDELLNIADYELKRDEIRSSIYKLKENRRFFVGENITLLLENKKTMLYQIQEMCRTERIVQPTAVQHEIDTYKKLATDETAVRMTLLIEYADNQVRDEQLKKLLGLENHLFIETCDSNGKKSKIIAKFDQEQIGDDRISSVQYIEFPLTGDQLSAIRNADKISIEVDHKNYMAVCQLNQLQLQALKTDLD